MTYAAPRITATDTLSGKLGIFASKSDVVSDAEVKHGIQPLEQYEAPAVTGRTELNGELVAIMSKKAGR